MLNVTSSARSPQLRTLRSLSFEVFQAQCIDLEPDSASDFDRSIYGHVKARRLPKATVVPVVRLIIIALPSPLPRRHPASLPVSPSPSRNHVRLLQTISRCQIGSGSRNFFCAFFSFDIARNRTDAHQLARMFSIGNDRSEARLITEALIRVEDLRLVFWLEKTLRSLS